MINAPEVTPRGHWPEPPVSLPGFSSRLLVDGKVLMWAIQRCELYEAKVASAKVGGVKDKKLGRLCGDTSSFLGSADEPK